VKQEGVLSTSIPLTRDSLIAQEGIVAGVIGGSVVAIFFLILDTLMGRPFYTPSVLGAALFSHDAGAALLQAWPASLEMAMMFTWVHFLIFAALGGLASRLLAVTEDHPSLGFGILLLFVLGDMAVSVGEGLFAERVLKFLAWPEIIGANLLAAVAMAAYFRVRHPGMRISP
jgi:hypothetical protein